jgi:3-hexulose-6-phosphate synthase
MKLQVAIDVLTTEAALEIAGKVAEYVDIIELGTPLVKSEGLSAVTAIKDAHPDKVVFADLKTMDAGELEADIAFKAGADLVSVLGGADDSTIAGAVKAAKAHNKFIEFHAGLDEQAKPGYNLDVLLSAGEEARVPFSVAGGVNLSTIGAVQRAGADVAVVGGSIYGADDPALAAKQLRAAII